LMAFGDDIKEYKDWEDLLRCDRAKRIRVWFLFIYLLLAHINP
jgi:hypothetical protein